MLHKQRWTAQKIAQRIELIEPQVYRRRAPLASFRYATLPGADAAPPVDADVEDGDWQRIEPYSYWGGWETNFVLRSSFQVPEDWRDDLPVALYLPIGEAGDFSHPEALVYVDGSAYAGCDRHHQEVALPDAWRDGKVHLLALHGWTGLGSFLGTEPHAKLQMNPCFVVQVDQPTRDFIATARVALGIAQHLNDDVPAKGQLLNALNDAFIALDTREPLADAFYASVPAAHKLLRAAIEEAGAPLDVDVVTVGHAHIDVAWLWTLGQTRRKAGRTFHTVLRLMERDPDYHFVQSQPQLYEYVRQDYPELFAAIKERVAEGRWEPIGGMWVEADCNLSGGESLARQFLLGKRFFAEHFGADAASPVLWLPDVFGYAWALPQLIKEAGLDYFMTIKIGWNQYNRLPYDSFWWQGLDGTKVLTHFSTTPDVGFGVSTYNAKATPAQALGIWSNFQQKELQRELLMIYGHGDGGGGPTREMLENIRELRAFPATPRLRQDSAGTFFRNLETNAGERLPTWNAELYFELHRGTYTTQSRNKRANRKSEFLLHDAEFLAALAATLDGDYAYPHEELREAWSLVCLNQFHDIIPGSSVAPVYAEALEQYATVAALGRDATARALGIIAGRIGGDLLLANPTSFACMDLAFWAGELGAGQQLQHPDGRPVATQATEGGVWIDAGPLAPYSVTALQLAEGKEPQSPNLLTAAPDLLENAYLRVELDAAGDIVRVFDKVNTRELLPAGAVANQFQAFEDRPMAWDAWDVDIFYDDKMWTAEPATAVEVVEAGPLRAMLEIRRRVLGSEYVQKVSLAHNSPRLDFATTIDWQERHTLLKVAFPVEVFAPAATYEIQWGNVERPTHRNTSWDWARFETCAQKWVDLSEGDYGVSLLNDCKYGHDIRDGIMRITLLRSSTHPDPNADRGVHHFAYSLLPHAGRWGEATVAAAYALNDPLLAVAGSGGESSTPALPSLISAGQPNIVIETVKQAEDGRGIIVRFYESQRRRGTVTLTAAFEVAAAWQTNLLEEEKAALEVSGNRIVVPYRPYQIVTLRLVPKLED